jgi:hypothetical protein
MVLFPIFKFHIFSCYTVVAFSFSVFNFQFFLQFLFLFAPSEIQFQFFFCFEFFCLKVQRQIFCLRRTASTHRYFAIFHFQFHFSVFIFQFFYFIFYFLFFIFTIWNSIFICFKVLWQILVLRWRNRRNGEERQSAKGGQCVKIIDYFQYEFLLLG